MDQIVELNIHAQAPQPKPSEGALTALLRQACRLNAQLEPGMPPDWLIKKIRFLSYDLAPLVQPHANTNSRLTTLNHFFFEKKHFRLQLELSPQNEPDDLCLLHRALSNRAGSPTVLALLYSWLAVEIGIELQFVDLHPTCFLKFVEQGKSHFIDLAKKGQILDCDGLLDHLNERYKTDDLRVSALLETVSLDGFYFGYLTEVRQAFLHRDRTDALLAVQDAMVRLQPNNIRLLGERSVLHFKLGHFKSALADLKRYFAFIERDKSPSALVKIYDDLMYLTKR